MRVSVGRGELYPEVVAQELHIAEVAFVGVVAKMAFHLDLRTNMEL